MEMSTVESGKTVVWIVRHGERIDAVDHSWEDTASRPFDPPLTEIGKKQAFAAGRRLKELIGNESDKVILVSSPFTRTMETTTEISKHFDNAPIKVEDGLTEWLVSHWFQELPTFDLGTFNIDAEYQSFHKMNVFPETVQDLEDKYVNTVKHLIDRFSGRHVVCVTHGYGVQIILQVLGSNIKKVSVYNIGYCCISSLVKTENDSTLSVPILLDRSHCNNL